MTSTTRQRRPPLVLELDVTEGLIEAPPADPLSAALSQRRPRLQDVLDGLRRASSDPQVTTLVLRVGGSRLTLTQAQELRNAISAFRAAGKRTVAWAESFGEFGAGNVPYLLAVACEHVYLQPSGDVGLTGIGIEEHFLSDALTKAGVTPQLGRRHEYKTAANTYLERAYTDAHREMSERLVTALSRQLVDAVAAGRGLRPERVRELVDRAPLLASEALEAGLIDGLAYRDEVYARIRRDVGARARLQYVTRYRRTTAQNVSRQLGSARRTDVIALIHGAGIVRQGRGARHPLGSAMGSDTVSAAFRAALRDDRVRAIVFRVDSPGGSYVASDAIWRHVTLARRHGTPVVVSMGRLAASGGYFVSMGADTIVAQPGTLTGSIGVLGGKAVTAELKARIGLTHDAVADGSNALMFSTNRGYTDSQWERLHTSLDRIYADFTDKVAQGRGLDASQVDELARGRVWTGAEAYEHGLVDELGGLRRAVELAKQKAGLEPDVEVDLRPFPRTAPWERLRPPRSSEDVGAVLPLDAVREAGWGNLAQAAASMGLPAAGPLTLPGAWRIR
ncbi:S49 family peptidase [Haloactinopolyspora alba]|uniref:S49 family peptidase n=1 Tax=Haloactinopolyspora alba TaxID=648780 RepID=UPI00197AB73D|nr:S49 family peptidase [Haloactinopolyspora alba]